MFRTLTLIYIACKDEIPNCETCSKASECDICRSGYEKIGGKCISNSPSFIFSKFKGNSECSIAHCSSCSDSTTCSQCKEGYSLNNRNECHLISNNPSQASQSCNIRYEII